MSGRHALPAGVQAPAAPPSSGHRHDQRALARREQRQVLLDWAQFLGAVLALMASASGSAWVAMTEAEAGNWYSVATSAFALAALASGAAALIERHRGEVDDDGAVLVLRLGLWFGGCRRAPSATEQG